MLGSLSLKAGLKLDLIDVIVASANPLWTLYAADSNSNAERTVVGDVDSDSISVAPIT